MQQRSLVHRFAAPRAIRRSLLLVAGTYLLAYATARLTVFHAVERYRGADGKSGPRHDLIAMRDRPPGEGWPYRLFLPLIRVEDGAARVLRDLQSNP
ncbi:hypothetical protein [Cyanobium sp. CH-040]|uniref:hypothetical protein n=1 Tax=Cyanobium sp. CH-040 TaxID=2823708 RepID=UPI0020CF1868|nr:hypothetical protein [Cyanobium sp. CH-040]MCP9927447.1 hypothetical protein [Cyanobium sp. CH-040]